VFSEVFHAKWTDSASGEGGKAQFAAILFSGLMVFNFVAECVSKAPGLILSNPNYVKKLVFPLELLPLVVTLSATITMGISVAILLAFQFFVLGVFHLTALFFPIVLLPVFLAVLGVQWFLSALGVYVRDIGQTVGIVLTGLMFLSPIFFPTEAIPEKWRLLVHLNPIAIPIEQGRELLIFGRMPHFGAWSVALLVGCLVAWGGYCWFQFTRRGFADVI
jgi:lipopolysaccharide transport system permease protein